MKAIMKKIVAVGALAAAFTLSPSVFASDRFPLPHEILGIPTPHELLGIPAPHEFLLGPDRFSRYNYHYDGRGYDRPYYHSYDRPYYRSYDRHEWREHRDWRDDRHDRGHDHDHGGWRRH